MSDLFFEEPDKKEKTRKNIKTTFNLTLIFVAVVGVLIGSGQIKPIKERLLSICIQHEICKINSPEFPSEEIPNTSVETPALSEYAAKDDGFTNLLLPQKNIEEMVELIQAEASINNGDFEIELMRSTRDVRRLLRQSLHSRTLHHSTRTTQKPGYYTRLINQYLSIIKPAPKLTGLVDIIDLSTNTVDIAFQLANQDYHWSFIESEQQIPTEFYQYISDFVAVRTTGALVRLPSSDGKQSLLYLQKDLAQLLLGYQVVFPLD